MTEYRSPVQNPVISSFFGPRLLNGVNNFHPGIDIISSNRYGGDLLSMAPGAVVGRFSYSDGNKSVLILNDDGRAILYSGLKNNTWVTVGTHVDAGDKIGEQGNTDRSVYHTHIEVINGVGVDQLGFRQSGVDGRGNPVWTLNNQAIGPTNQVTYGLFKKVTRPGLEYGLSNSSPDVYDLSLFLPPESVFPAWPVSPQSQHQAPNHQGWPADTWDAISGDQFIYANSPEVPQVKRPSDTVPLPRPRPLEAGPSAREDNRDFGGQSAPFISPFEPGQSGGAGLPGSPFQSYSRGEGYNPWNPSTYVSPTAPLPDSRLITTDPASYAPPYLRSGEPPSLSILRGGLDPTSYDPARPRPLNPNSGPGTGGGDFERGPRPQSPSRMNSLPDSGASAFFDPPGRAPQQAYGSPQSGWSEVPTTPDSVLTPQPFSPASFAPSVRPTENAGSSFALTAQAPDARPLTGNGILSGLSAATGRRNGILGGLTPADAWPSPRGGILGGLTPPSMGDSGSGSPEGDDHPSWAQMLQDMWLRRMQDDPSADASNR